MGVEGGEVSISAEDMNSIIHFYQTSLFKYFPTMKPEKKALELSEDEKVLMNLLKANSPIDLNELKEETGLSNKKWDKAIKGLTKNKLARVEKTDAGLLVSLG